MQQKLQTGHEIRNGIHLVHVGSADDEPSRSVSPSQHPPPDAFGLIPKLQSSLLMTSLSSRSRSQPMTTKMTTRTNFGVQTTISQRRMLSMVYGSSRMLLEILTRIPQVIQRGSQGRSQSMGYPSTKHEHLLRGSSIKNPRLRPTD